MNVAELITELQRLDPEMEVAVGFDYGDYWHTPVAKTATQAVQYVTEPSGMYDGHLELLDEEWADEDPDGPESKEVVVISAGRWNKHERY